MTQEQDQNSSEQVFEAIPLTLDDVLTPDHLRLIAQAAGNFRFVEDKIPNPNLPPGIVGYTDMETRTIHINSKALPHFNKPGLEGFLYHEAGHHAPDVAAFWNRLIQQLDNKEIIPEAYRGSPSAEIRFLKALHSHLHNCLTDIWDEAYMSRDRYGVIIGDRFRSLYSTIGQRENLRNLSRPEQLVQLLVGEARYGSTKPLAELVDDDVYQAYERIVQTGALKTLQDARYFHGLSAPAQRARSLERKYTYYEQVFLPEYLKLLEKELEERKKAKQQQNEESRGKGQSPEGQSEGTPQSGGASDAAPLTKEEEEDLLNQILNDLEKASQGLGSQAPTKEEDESLEDKLNRIKKALESQAKVKKDSPVGSGQDSEQGKTNQQPGKKGEDALRDLSSQLEQSSEEDKRRGLAAANQVRVESVSTWKNIKEQYKRLIEKTANDLAEIFVDNRRKKMSFGVRVGDIIPGLEYEEVAAIRSGEVDPKTKQRVMQALSILETEMEFIVDTSGSVGSMLSKFISLMVITVESFKKVRETLEGENLLVNENEQPFKVGATKYSVGSERITELDEPLTDKKEIKIVDKASLYGGGTDEAQAVMEVYQGMTLRAPNVIKIIVLLTDGYGNKEAVAPVMRQIEEDNQVVFLAVGVGQGAKEVVKSYVDPLRYKNQNVIGIEAEDIDIVIPEVLRNLRREVTKRKDIIES